jgi:hypothetical protein
MKEVTMIPDLERSEIRAIYVKSVLDSPEVGQALQQRGQLAQLDRVADTYATEMLAEVERLAAEYQLDDEPGPFWDRWQRFIPVPTTQRLEEGRAWLPHREILLKGFPEPLNGHSKRKVGFQPPEPPPPPPPPPAVTIADVEAIVARAVAEALAKPTSSEVEVAVEGPDGQVKRSKITTKRRPA